MDQAVLVILPLPWLSTLVALEFWNALGGHWATGTGNAGMIIGTSDTFAIEIGEEEPHPEFRDVYVRFRYWVDRVPVGDWNELISLSASIQGAAGTCAKEGERRRLAYAPCPSSNLFREVYDAVFSLHCFVGRSGGVDLRALYHLDAIGMGALRNKYGLVLVASSDGMERIVVKDLNQEQFIADVFLPLGTVESTLTQYIAWGRSRLQMLQG